MKKNQLIQIIWESNQDLLFEEVRRVADVAEAAAEAEMVAIRRAKYSKTGTQQPAMP